MILGAFFGNSGEAVGVFILGAMIAYPTTLILGVPAFVALRFFKLDGLGVYLLAGAAMGSMVYVFLGPNDLLAELSRSMFFPALAVGSGIVAAGTFWTIVRPDIQ